MRTRKIADEAPVAPLVRRTGPREWRTYLGHLEPESDGERIHSRATRLLAQALDEGVWQPGDQIPGERELAAHFGISVLTANKAVSALERQGRVLRRGGRGGTVVTHLAKNQPLSLVLGTHCSLTRASADFYSAGIMRGVQAVLGLRRFAATASFVEDWSPEEIADRLGKSVSGILLIAPQESRRQAIADLASMNVPTVVVGASWPTAHVPTVDCDNFQGMQASLDYLISLGHRRIACLYAWPDASNHRDRLQAFRLHTARSGITPPSDWIAEAFPSKPLVRAPMACPALPAMLSSTDRPTAIVVTDYQIVSLLAEAAASLGLAIPADLSVVSFDDPAPSARLTAALTTIDQPLEEMGKAALELLIDICSRELPRSDILLPMTLNVRNSCAPRSSA